MNTKLEPISWELNVDNPLFTFGVGVWVGGYPLEMVLMNEKTRKKIPHIFMRMTSPRSDDIFSRLFLRIKGVLAQFLFEKIYFIGSFQVNNDVMPP